ncbi:MAG: hypothetical protein PVI00_15410 [Desulfobacterales bacterium]
MNTKKKKYDDLTEIKGIGMHRQQWLKRSFGVSTFSDLAALTVDEVETRLKAEKSGVGRKTIEVWIDKAKALAEAASPEQELEAPTVESGGGASLLSGEIEWSSLASFQVDFQTRQAEDRVEEQRTQVHHIETDSLEKWSGIQTDRLFQWIQNQLNEIIKEKPAKEPPTAELLSSETLPSQKLAVTYVRVFQPPKAETPIGSAPAGRPFPGMLKADQPFTLQAGFELDKLAADEAAGSKVTYKAEFHARNRSTGAKHHLGNSKPKSFVAGRVSYDTVLPKVRLNPGHYSLGVLVTIQSRTSSIGHLELPLLKVL